MQNTEGGRKLNQAMVSTGRAVATTSKAIGGAVSHAKGAFSSWFSNLLVSPDPAPKGVDAMQEEIDNNTVDDNCQLDATDSSFQTAECLNDSNISAMESHNDSKIYKESSCQSKVIANSCHLETTNDLVDSGTKFITEEGNLDSNWQSTAVNHECTNVKNISKESKDLANGMILSEKKEIESNGNSYKIGEINTV